jgi:hypothetical protein
MAMYFVQLRIATLIRLILLILVAILLKFNNLLRESLRITYALDIRQVSFYK